MGERPASTDKPTSEALAATGLFLNIASVIALAIGLASFGASHATLAAVAGIGAVLTFIASLVCFSKQATEAEPQPASA
ncbi:hypothetical protein A5662_13530 [Mycobacteriaceae bacterium 1482268.1]|nr:hypothetical protein A5662_13530 [Mycobacteriaceae bacterium 1482268.1]